MRKFLPVWALGGLMLLQGRGQARPMWVVPPLSAFNGASWGDLRLGQTTFRQIRAKYATGEGLYDDSTALTQPKKAALRVDLLWDKSGGNGRLQAITVYFDGWGPHRAAVEGLFAPQGRAANLYRPTRYEAWRIASLAPRGVALFTLNEGEQETLPMILMTSPPALGALSGLSSEATPVAPLIDPHEGEPKVAGFSRIDVDFTGSGDLDLPGEEKSWARDSIATAYASGALRYDARAGGTYNVKTLGYNRGKKGGMVYARVSISGEGPYGPIHASGSEWGFWKWSDEEVGCNRYCDCEWIGSRLRGSYRDAVSAARGEAEASFARQMAQSGPPSLFDVRWNQWKEIVADVREKTRPQVPVEALYPSVLR